MRQVVIYCPSCGSDDVLKQCLTVNVVRVSMDALPVHFPEDQYAVVQQPDRYRVTCQSCGYTREYDGY